MERSFKDYIANPLGAKSAVMSSREMYNAMYTSKFNLLMVRENSKIHYELFKGEKNYYIYLKIPSEQIKDFYYDVVVQFVPTKISDLENKLDNYTVRFYSNDPSFVFTFAHAFIKNDMFINDLKPKMSKLAIKNNANEKNPDNQIGYVKSLYFAYLFIKSRGLFNKVHYVAAKKYDKNYLLSTIMEADEKIRLRQEAAQELNKSKRGEQTKQQTHNNPFGFNWNKSNFVSNVSKVNPVGKVITDMKSKFVRKTKTTKRF